MLMAVCTVIVFAVCAVVVAAAVGEQAVGVAVSVVEHLVHDDVDD